MLRKTLILMALILPCGSLAQAGMLELRGGVGRTSGNADDFDEQAEAAGNDGVDANDFGTYNADIFFNIPAFPIGVGIRHEWMNISEGSGGSDVDLEATNLSLLVDLRLLDTPVFYVGPIISAGHPSAKVDFDSGNVSIDDDVDAKDLSYSAGLEAGFYLGHFLIGGEAGYQSVEFETVKTNQGQDVNFDASGFYGKLMVGLTFF
jgi:hypothetical protein